MNENVKICNNCCNEPVEEDVVSAAEAVLDNAKQGRKTYLFIDRKTGEIQTHSCQEDWWLDLGDEEISNEMVGGSDTLRTKEYYIVSSKEIFWEGWDDKTHQMSLKEIRENIRHLYKHGEEDQSMLQDDINDGGDKAEDEDDEGR